MPEIAATAAPLSRSLVPSDGGAVGVPAPVPTTPVPGVLAQAATAATPATPASGTQPAARSAEAVQAQIDRVLEDADTSLRFRVDEEAERVVVAVLDGRGEVIMQVPDEAALALARRIARGGSLIDDRA